MNECTDKCINNGMNDAQHDKSSMEVLLDGQPHRIPCGSTLEDLVLSREADADSVATAVNGQFVPRGGRSRPLQAGDTVLIFRAITGG